MNTNQKGIALTGGALSDDAIASSESLFHTDQFGNQKGLQQFYSPPEAAKLAKKVMGDRIAVLDLTAGDGSLLQEFGPTLRFGVEIDGDQIKNAAENHAYTAIQGDLQHVFTLLHRGTAEWNGIVMNPPFGLMWEDPTVRNGRPTNSAVMTLIYAMRLLAEDGQFVFIAGRDRFKKQIADMPEAAGIYAVIECDDMFEGTSLPSIMAFGMHPSLRKAGDSGYETRPVPRSMLDFASEWVTEVRARTLSDYSSPAYHEYSVHTRPDTFKAIQTEYDRRTEKRVKKNREYDLLSHGGNVQWLPSGYATAALNKVNEFHTFYGLNGQSLNYFVQNESLWVKLKALASSGIVTVEPRLFDTVDELVEEARKEVLPLYEIKPQQRLGWLTEIDYIKCKADWPEQGFAKGELYRVNARSQTVIEEEMRVEESKKNPGEYVNRRYTKQRKVLRVRIGTWSFDDGKKEEASENIQNLVDYFELPDPGTVATRHPEELKRLEELAFSILDTEFLPNSREWEKKNPKSTPYRHSDFQKKDISRLAFKKGGLLSWDMGLGKTLGAILFCRMMEQEGAKRQWLFVVPGDLVPQWKREFERFMGVTPKVLRPWEETVNKKRIKHTMQGQCHRLAKYLKAGGEGIYLVHYEALAIAGTKMKTLPTVVVEEKTDMVKVKFTGRHDYFYFNDDEEGRSTISEKEGPEGERVYREQIRITGPNDPALPEGKSYIYGYIRERWEPKVKQITSRELCPECHADTRNGWNGTYCHAEDASGKKCGYAHVEVKIKPASSILSNAFKKGVIVLDEATYIGSRNGAPSQRSLAIRGMTARHKLAMTGTPIKNFVGQAFWLLWWCLGNGSKRFGYTYDGGHSKFEADFSVIEWLNNGGKKEARKVLPEVTNLAMLWKLLASSCIRRRKEDTGEELPPKFYTDIKTPLGVTQAEQMKVWLKDFPKLFEEKYPDAPVVKAGMHEVMAPMLGLNWKLDYALTMPEADPDYQWTQVEGVTNYTPANLRVLELAMALAKDGRKVLIGSHLIAASKWLAERLVEKGVKAIHIVEEDGTTANKDKRAQRVHSFQTDEAQVFCAGVKAIRLGHNLDAANAVILHGLDWDYETTTQFVDRVHRRTSTQPVDIYCVLPTLSDQETLTSRKWDILAMKGQAADLALDGRLIEQHEISIDQNTVIRELMARGFNITDDAVDELDIEDAFGKLPQLDYFDTKGVIPERPEIVELDTSEEDGAAALCAFLSHFAATPEAGDAQYAYAEDDGGEDAEPEPTIYDDAHWDELEAELAEIEKVEVPDGWEDWDSSKLTIPAEVELTPEQYEGLDESGVIPELVAEDTSSSDSSPATSEVEQDVDPQKAMLAMMEQMQAQLAAMQAKNEELEARLEARDSAEDAEQANAV